MPLRKLFAVWRERESSTAISSMMLSLSLIDCGMLLTEANHRIENILKTSTGNYKLTDLGAWVVRHLYAEDRYSPISTESAAKYMDTCMKNCKEGRHAYECLQRRFYPDINGPPEAFTGNFLTTKADMWALGWVWIRVSVTEDRLTRYGYVFTESWQL